MIMKQNNCEFFIQDRILVPKEADIISTIKDDLSTKNYIPVGDIDINTHIPQPWEDKIWVQYIVKVKKEENIIRAKVENEKLEEMFKIAEEMIEYFKWR
ncbi:MAG: hypothetical protein DDT23_00987 [candidate division WS2 bacterium]|nr:hypothetical protein [Candidatus Lithacetigena glycinireducens]